jgi:hypothetical protein
VYRRTRPIRQQRAVRQFQSGDSTIELINSGVSDGVAWLVMIEHGTVLFVGRDEPARWELRVTEVFQRRDDDWTRVHRHADPLVDRHPLDQVLGILGET